MVEGEHDSGVHGEYQRIVRKHRYKKSTPDIFWRARLTIN
jgi:hypothetical protein